MENPLNEAHEEIKHLEHLSASRLRVAMTVTILVITVLATVAGSLAALWSGRQSEAQTARQQATAAALRDELSATTQEAAVAQSEDDSVEAGWRSTFLYEESAQVTDAKVKRTLLSQQQRAYRISKQIDRTLPHGGDSAAYYAQLQRPATRDEEAAKAEARRGVAWLAKNNSALAVVSILALALFLVGLALTINNRRVQIGFTALSVVMLLFGGGWLGAIAASPIDVPTERCIDGYTDASAALSAGSTQDARGRLEKVTGACPSYSDAWAALAQASFDPGNATARRAVEDAELRALRTADTASPILLNNVGSAALLDHDLPAAASYLAAADRIGADNPVVLSSVAELAAVRGDARAANQALEKSLALVAQHGPYYRDNVYFPALRQDVASFAAAGLHTAALDRLFRTAKQAEASLDSLRTVHPGTTHGARISDPEILPAKKIGGVGGFLTVTFHFTGLRPGDHISLRYYTSGDTTYQETASEPDIVVGKGSALDGSGVIPAGDSRIDIGSVGRLTLEIYLNGVFQASTNYDT